MSLIDYLPLVISLVGASIVFVVTAQMGAHGRLPPNGVIGFRTASTLQSDAAWEAGHRAAVPALRILALVQAVGAGLTFVLGWFLQSPFAIPCGIGALLLTGSVLLVLSATSVKTAAHTAHQEWLERQSRKL